MCIIAWPLLRYIHSVHKARPLPVTNKLVAWKALMIQKAITSVQIYAEIINCVHEICALFVIYRLYILLLEMPVHQIRDPYVING